MTAPTTAGPEADLPGTIRSHPNGGLYVRREIEHPRSILRDAPWVAIVGARPQTGRVTHLFDEDMEGSELAGAMPGTPAAYVVSVALSGYDLEGAVDELAQALCAEWVTEYSWNPKPWGELRPEHQRQFRRRARSVLPVLERWKAYAQKLSEVSGQ